MSDDTETGGTKNTDTPDTPVTGNVVDINRWRDFNDAEPQRLDDAWPAHAVQSTDEIKARMLVHIRGVLSYLFPGGVFQRGKFFVGDIRGNPGDIIGLWAAANDFATGEGGDIIGLWAAARPRSPISGHGLARRPSPDPARRPGGRTPAQDAVRSTSSVQSPPSGTISTRRAG